MYRRGRTGDAEVATARSWTTPGTDLNVRDLVRSQDRSRCDLDFSGRDKFFRYHRQDLSRFYKSLRKGEKREKDTRESNTLYLKKFVTKIKNLQFVRVISFESC